MSTHHLKSWADLVHTAKTQTSKDSSFLVKFILILTGSYLFGGFLIYYIQDKSFSGFLEYAIIGIGLIILLFFLGWHLKNLRKPPLLLKAKITEITEANYANKEFKNASLIISEIIFFNEKGIIEQQNISHKASQKLIAIELLDRLEKSEKEHWFLTLPTGKLIAILDKLPGQ